MADDDLVKQVWQKGKVVPDYDPARFRKDQCDAWMAFADYGNRDSKLGWEIDHIKPKDDGGTDELSNLRPLQWGNNASKSAGRLVCVVTSSGEKNIDIKK